MTQPKQFRAILFDMDGLMVDTERLYIHANQVIAQKHGKQVTDFTISKMMGRGTLESLRIFADDLGITTAPEQLVIDRQAIMLELMASDLVIMPGLRELLDYVRPRFRLALVTGSATRLMQEVIDRLCVNDCFEVLQSCDEVKCGKPDPEIYLRACARLALPPGDCIVLEDSGNGVRAGAAAGCYVIAVPNDHTRHHDLSPANAIVPDLHAAREHIARL